MNVCCPMCQLYLSMDYHDINKAYGDVVAVEMLRGRITGAVSFR